MVIIFFLYLLVIYISFLRIDSSIYLPIHQLDGLSVLNFQSYLHILSICSLLCGLDCLPWAQCCQISQCVSQVIDSTPSQRWGHSLLHPSFPQAKVLSSHLYSVLVPGLSMSVSHLEIMPGGPQAI